MALLAVGKMRHSLTCLFREAKLRLQYSVVNHVESNLRIGSVRARGDSGAILGIPDDQNQLRITLRIVSESPTLTPPIVDTIYGNGTLVSQRELFLRKCHATRVFLPPGAATTCQMTL